MKILVVNSPSHHVYQKKDGEKWYNCFTIKMPCSSALTIIDHDAKLLQEEVDISVLFELPSLCHQHQDTPTFVHVVTKHMELQNVS